MHVLIDVSLVPLGVGLSLSRYVAACERVFTEAGLTTRLHAYGTNVEGEWDDVFAAVKRCHDVLHEMGAPRVSTVIKAGTRTDRAQSLDDKVQSVEDKLTQC
ncbi:MAG: MTH1187 family thiamine-binding protein [Vicinamibacterales bacterium]|nr:MTH1187 family thiamine-binding protein [Vicinamibacterales bacterium]